MKAIKLVALTSAAALLAACGTGNGGWKKVSNEKFAEEIAKVADFNYATATVTGSTEVKMTVTGSGEDWETYGSAILGYLGLQEGENSSTQEINESYTFNGEAWVEDEGSTNTVKEMLYQMNVAEYWLEEEDESTEEETEEGTAPIVETINYYTGKGFKVEFKESQEGSGSSTETITLNEKAYVIKNEMNQSVNTTMDFSDRGMNMVITLSGTTKGAISITYAGEFTAEAA